jgi:diguanylate cyclase (GGDEF)-like protein
VVPLSRLGTERFELATAAGETDTIRLQANQISMLCDKIKEMSQSLDPLETFLVFGEALSRSFRFDCLKLIFFREPEGDAEREPDEMYQLFHSDFQGLFDRSVFLKDRGRARGEIFAFDRKIMAALSKSGKSLYFIDPTRHSYGDDPALFAEGSPFLAYPVFIDRRLSAVLIILGVRAEDIPIFSVLTESFIAEIERIKLYEKVGLLAMTDGLTGISVRRHLLARLQDETERSRRLGLKLSFLMIDIDDFKHFNDQYGHLVGDVVLKEVAETVKRNIREVDLVGRYGGEEFGVFLIETDESGAFFVAERIRRAIAERTYKAYDEDLSVTVSIGCATRSGPEGDSTALIESADAALYEAKRLGKNRVHLASMGITPGSP